MTVLACILIIISIFLVYLSTCLADTFNFILSGKRPDCWHFIESSESSSELSLKISALTPKNCTFITSDMDNDYICSLSSRIVTFIAENKEVHNLVCNSRNPLKIEKWTANALDSCFVHVGKDEAFPLCSDDDRENDLAILRNWSFTALNRPTSELLRLSFRVFEDFGLLREFGIEEAKFKQFLLAVKCNYFDNPYHNFCHVVDVLQCCYYLLKHASDGQLPSLLGPTHLFALLIGCLCHDLGHLSFGNNFLKDSEHPLAILFNDSSVLENYHAMVLFSILRCPPYNWLEGGSSEFAKKDFRKCVLGCILGTDMSNHFEFIKQFTESFPTATTTETLSPKDKVMLATALIKCSDISNVLRPFEIAKMWGIALLEEFFAQGDYEKCLNLPLGPLNDRNSLKTGPAQHQFLTVVAAPLYRAFAAKIKGLDCFDQWIADNAQKWLNYKEEHK